MRGEERKKEGKKWEWGGERDVCVCGKQAVLSEENNDAERNTHSNE